MSESYEIVTLATLTREGVPLKASEVAEWNQNHPRRGPSCTARPAGAGDGVLQRERLLATHGAVVITKQRLPRTMKALWDTGWVAENEEEAVRQALRMFDLFADRPIRVDRLTMRFGDEYDEELFRRPWPHVVAYDIDLERGWDGDVFYADWYVRPVNLDQRLTSITGKAFRMREIWADNEGQLVTTAPGIGTAEGFGHKDRLIYPEASS